MHLPQFRSWEVFTATGLLETFFLLYDRRQFLCLQNKKHDTQHWGINTYFCAQLQATELKELMHITIHTNII